MGGLLFPLPRRAAPAHRYYNRWRDSSHGTSGGDAGGGGIAFLPPPPWALRALEGLLFPLPRRAAPESTILQAWDLEEEEPEEGWARKEEDRLVSLPRSPAAGGSSRRALLALLLLLDARHVRVGLPSIENRTGPWVENSEAADHYPTEV